MYSLLLGVELLILFSLSKFLFQSLFFVLLRVLKSKKLSTGIVALIFFPGVVIHELSHMLMAGLLFVPVAHLEFSPEWQEGGLKLGSVQIVKTDFLRRFLIGAAPIIIGLFLLLIFTSYASGQISLQGVLSETLDKIMYGFILYGIFAISNTMFSSKRDMEGAVGILLFFVLLAGNVYIIKKDLLFSLVSFLQGPIATQYLEKTTQLLLIPCSINLLLGGIFYVLRRE